MPTAVICELLGVPFEDRPDFRLWSTTIVTPTRYGPDAVAMAMRECAGYMSRLIERRRWEPGEDVLSALIEAHDEGDRLTEPELIDLMTQMLLAGHETTVSLIGSAVVLLARHPEQLAAVRADPALVPSTIEEVLRYESPADASLLRVATADVTIGGVTIRKGEGVLAHTGSANFDETRFPDPARFEIARRDNPHLGFGHGIHFCFGAPLARLEGQVALAALLRRFPGLRLAVAPEQIQWRPPLTVRGPAAVPVTW